MSARAMIWMEEEEGPHRGGRGMGCAVAIPGALR